MTDETLSPRTAADAPDPCPAPAVRVVFRGAARLHLCEAHAAAYRGRGRVAEYRGVVEWTGERSSQPGVYVGPARTCEGGAPC